MSAIPRLLKRPPRAALRAGCAPGVWNKQLGRARERAARLAHLCQWAEAGLQAERTRLRPRTWLGACLDELVAALSGEDRPPPENRGHEHPSHTRLRGDASLAPPERKPHRSPKAGQPHKTHRPSPDDRLPAAASHQALASRTLLERLAGPPHRYAASSARRHFARQPRVRLSLTPAADHKSLQGGRPAGRPDRLAAGGGQATLAPQIAARARHALNRGPHKTAARFAFHQEPPAAEAVLPGALEQQWGWSLSGETIPGKQLQSLESASRREVGSDPERRPHPEGKEPVPGPFHRSLPESLLQQNAYKGRGRSRKSTSPGSTDEDARIPASGASAPGLLSAQDSPGPGASDAAPPVLPHDPSESLAGPAPRFAPPQISPTLPALRSVQHDEAALTPAAAFAAERSARREAVETAPEDLDELARNLRRILEAEARRHGIDV